MNQTYSVGINFCNCHPETCCCNRYAIFENKDGKMVKHSTHYAEKTAKEIAASLNSTVKQKHSKVEYVIIKKEDLRSLTFSFEGRKRLEKLLDTAMPWYC